MDHPPAAWRPLRLDPQPGPTTPAAPPVPVHSVPRSDPPPWTPLNRSPSETRRRRETPPGGRGSGGNRLEGPQKTSDAAPQVPLRRVIPLEPEGSRPAGPRPRCVPMSDLPCRSGAVCGAGSGSKVFRGTQDLRSPRPRPGLRGPSPPTPPFVSFCTPCRGQGPWIGARVGVEGGSGASQECICKPAEPAEPLPRYFQALLLAAPSWSI